jgi:hypothetical protein
LTKNKLTEIWVFPFARASNNCKRQTYPLVREDYDGKDSVEKKIAGRESQGARRNDELIGGKPLVVK